MAITAPTRWRLPEAQFCVFLFLTAFFLRTLFLMGLDESVLFMKYPYFAEKIASGESIGTRLADLSPFYLYWMSLLSILLDNHWPMVKWIHALVGSANCLLVYIIGLRVFRREVAILAAMMMVVYGNLIILETTLEPTVFVIFFNLLSVRFLLDCRKQTGDGHFLIKSLAAAGCFTGLSIITKPSFLLFIPLAVLWIIFFGNGHTRQRGIAILTFCAAAGLIVLPVTVRNAVIFDDFFLVTADAGKVFFHGNAKGATALVWTGLPNEGFREEGRNEPDYAHVLFRELASRSSGRTLLPSESSKFWTYKTLQDIVADPGTSLVRFLKKGVFFFTDYELHFIATAYKEYKSSLQFPFLRYGIIAALGIFGLIFGIKSRGNPLLIMGTLLLYLASGIIFIVQSRYRTPAVPYLCLFAGYGMFWLHSQWLAKHWRKLASGLAAVALLYFFSHQSFHSEIRAADHWQTATKIHYQLGGIPLFLKGDYEAAIRDLDICIAMAPRFSPAYNLRGKAWAMLGNYDKALANFFRVIELSPNLAQGYKNAGFAYLLNKDQHNAIVYLNKALRLAPKDKKVAETLHNLR